MVVQLRPVTAEPIGSGGAHQEDPEGPCGLLHADFAGTPKSDGIVPDSAGVHVVRHRQDVLVRIERELIQVFAVVATRGPEVDAGSDFEDGAEHDDRHEGGQQNRPTRGSWRR